MILKWCIEKTLRHLQNDRLENVENLSLEEWKNNNNTCLFLYRHLKHNFKKK